MANHSFVHSPPQDRVSAETKILELLSIVTYIPGAENAIGWPSLAIYTMQW